MVLRFDIDDAWSIRHAHFRRSRIRVCSSDVPRPALRCDARLRAHRPVGDVPAPSSKRRSTSGRRS